MKYINGTEILSSEIVLGCDGMGTVLDEKASFELLDEYIALGGNHLDTARVYGYPASESEKLLGRWLKARGNREKIVVTTKGAHPEPQTMHISRLSEKDIGGDVENSLKDLQTDYIDLYLLHRDDEKIPAGEIIETLNKYIKEGKIREIGASNWKAKRIEEANAYAEKHGLRGFAASQIKWSYGTVSDGFCEDPTLVPMDKEEYGRYLKNGITVFAYASQCKGFFSKYDKGGEEALSPKAKERYLCGENLERYAVAKEIAEANGCGIGAVILQYILNQPFTAFPIVGCKNIAQLRDSFETVKCNVSNEEILKLVEMGNRF